jgi:hypothetical protein
MYSLPKKRELLAATVYLQYYIAINSTVSVHIHNWEQMADSNIFTCLL